jgi:cell division septal protein FtsQ
VAQQVGHGRPFTRRKAHTASDLAVRHRRVAPARPTARPNGMGGNRRAAKRERLRAQIGRALKYVRAGVAFMFAIAIVGGLFYTYRAFATSNFFALRNVELRGDIRAPRDELISALHKNTEKGLWATSLEDLREKLRQHPWVRDAEVVRVLPDTLKVTITEREPYVLARLSNGVLVWVDRDGVILDEQGTFKGGPDDEKELPLLSGLRVGQEKNPGENREVNQQRLLAYQNLVAELSETNESSANGALIDRIDEVHFDELDGVHLHLARRRVKVVTSPGDYRRQLETALQVLDAIDRKDVEALELFRVTDAARLLGGVPVSYINTRSPDRVVIGLGKRSSEGRPADSSSSESSNESNKANDSKKSRPMKG